MRVTKKIYQFSVKCEVSTCYYQLNQILVLFDLKYFYFIDCHLIKVYFYADADAKFERQKKPYGQFWP